MSDPDVLVIGGGVSGLAAAWWLARRGIQVEVWEQDATAGGLVRSDRRNGYLTERAAALLLNYRPEVRQLLAESGVAGEKLPRGAGQNRYLVHDGRLEAVPMRLGAMVSSPLWSVRGTLRLLAEPFIPGRFVDGESVSSFITRRLGREVLTRAMEPYVAGPLASDPDRAEAASVLPRLTALERRYGSITAGILVHRLLRRRTACAAEGLSFRDGMGALVRALALAPGIRLRTGLTATSLARESARWRVSGTRGSGDTGAVARARHLVLAIPARPAADLLSSTDGDLAGLLGSVAYTPLAVVHLGFDRGQVRHPLDGTGFLVPRDAGLAINGCMWMSSLFAGRAPPGKVLVTCYLGGARRPRVRAWDDGRCAGAAVRDAGALLGIAGDPEMVRVDRHPRALPLYHGAHARRQRAMDARLAALRDLHLCASYRDGVSLRDRLVAGHAVAARIARALGCPEAPHTVPDAGETLLEPAGDAVAGTS